MKRPLYVKMEEDAGYLMDLPPPTPSNASQLLGLLDKQFKVRQLKLHVAQNADLKEKLEQAREYYRDMCMFLLETRKDKGVFKPSVEMMDNIYKKYNKQDPGYSLKDFDDEEDMRYKEYCKHMQETNDMYEFDDPFSNDHKVSDLKEAFMGVGTVQDFKATPMTEQQLKKQREDDDELFKRMYQTR